jgi:hypothetical protein
MNVFHSRALDESGWQIMGDSAFNLVEERQSSLSGALLDCEFSHLVVFLEHPLLMNSGGFRNGGFAKKSLFVGGF